MNVHIRRLALAAMLVAVSGSAISCSNDAKNAEKAAAYQNEVAISAGGVRSFRGATLAVSEGVPLLTLTGTPYEMGLAYGVLLRERLAGMQHELETFTTAALATRSSFERLVAPLYIKSYSRSMLKRIPAGFVDELHGVADGSGLSFDALAFASSGVGIFAEPMSSQAPHCTSILARLPDRIIHGRNFDFLPAIMGKYPIIIHYRPAGGLQYWSFGVIGYLPAFHGINEKGVSVTLNYGVSSFMEKADKSIPTTYKLRQLLGGASGLEDARSVLLGTPGDEPGWMLTVLSADEGKGAVFDILGNEHAVSEFTEPDYKVVFNRQFSYTRYPGGELARKYLYLSDGEGEYNMARFDSGTAHLKNSPVKSVEGMASFLKTTNFYGYEGIVYNLNGTITNDYTLNTLIFDWKSRKVYYSAGIAYSALYPMIALDLNNDAIARWREADPRLCSGRYKTFIDIAPEYQLRWLAQDDAWIARNTDFETADPHMVLQNLNAWIKDPSVISSDLLLRAADRLVKTYPDYNLPYVIKAHLVAKEDPTQAIELYKKALAARINFVPDRITQLADVAALYASMKDHAKAAATAKECLSIITEMRKKYVMDKWVVGIEKKMKKLAD